MFELQQMKEFNRRLKKILYRLFFRDEFPPYSIWEFCPMNRWNQVVEFLKYYSLCRTEWFPYIYWAVVLSSCLGFVCSLREFHMVWITPCHKLKMWRNRHFYILSHRRLRQARLGGSIISLVSWILLLFGIAKSSPFFMWPRIIVTGIVMFTEFLIWSFEVITGRVLIDIQTLISLTLPAFHFGMVRCLQNVFE
ncbi:hypothetical protein KR074_003188, partial [Drosophila pseudoananassae]